MGCFDADAFIFCLDKTLMVQHLMRTKYVHPNNHEVIDCSEGFIFRVIGWLTEISRWNLGSNDIGFLVSNIPSNQLLIQY